MFRVFLCKVPSEFLKNVKFEKMFETYHHADQTFNRQTGRQEM